jgi:hypothetical protein
MNALQQFKQKGRILRKFLATTFSTEVKLGQAYEAIALMEGSSNWNEFSARLVTSAKSEAAKAPVYPPLPAIRAIFRTVDRKAQAEFDASSWFAQASESEIAALLDEKPRMAPIGFELSYGGVNGCSDAVAEFVSKTDDQVKAVYGYIQALADAGGDCGGSDCYIDAHQVQRWFMARAVAASVSESAPSQAVRSEPRKGNVRRAVLDTELALPENAALLSEICCAAWDHAVGDWKRARSTGAGCQFIIEHSNIFLAIGDFNVVATGDEGYDDAIAEMVENAMQTAGYHSRAQMLAAGSASLDEPFKADPVAPEFQPVEVVYDSLQILEVMMQDFAGEYEVPAAVPEWQWVQEHASFSHVDNNTDGIWEFMVNVECEGDRSDMPAALKPLFAKARLHNAKWVMFHQGT